MEGIWIRVVGKYLGMYLGTDLLGCVRSSKYKCVFVGCGFQVGFCDFWSFTCMQLWKVLQ